MKIILLCFQITLSYYILLKRKVKGLVLLLKLSLHIRLKFIFYIQIITFDNSIYSKVTCYRINKWNA